MNKKVLTPPDLDVAALLAALPNPVLLLADTAYLNAPARELLGEGGADWLTLFPADAQAELAGAVAQAGAGHTLTLTVVLPSGLHSVKVAPVGRYVLLHLAEAPLQVAIDGLDRLHIGAVVHNPRGQILSGNASAQQILGLSRDQLLERDAVDPNWCIIHPDGTPFAPQDLPAVRVASGEISREVPMGVFAPNGDNAGTWRWLRVTALPELDEAARQIGAITVFVDETPAYHLRQQLTRSEERYRSLVEATAQVVWQMTPDGRFNAPQPAWEAFTGQTPTQYMDRGWWDAIHPDDREATRGAWYDRTAQLYTAEHRLRRADGQYVPMVVRAALVTDKAGEVSEWVGLHTDVSALREAERQLRALNTELERRVEQRSREAGDASRLSRLILDAAGEGIYGLDAHGHTTFVNRAASDLLGYTLSDLAGRPSHEVMHHTHADGTPHPMAECPIMLTLQDGQTRRADSDVFWNVAGQAVPVAYIVTATRDEAGQVTGAVVIFQDITERLRAEQALQQAIENLKRSNAELEQFAYVASHDLQEPLRTLGSYAELLSRRYQGQLDTRADQYLGHILEATMRLRGLIHDLLAFAKLGRTDLQTQGVALEDLLKETAQGLQAALQDSGGSLTWDVGELEVQGQRSLLLQLFTNLLGNALKFRRPDVPPVVRVYGKRKGDKVTIRCVDNGIGIAPEYHDRVFTIFQRLNRRETYPGNGMGLAISRKIAEFHGGTLEVESVLGEGSTFTLTLPVRVT